MRATFKDVLWESPRLTFFAEVGDTCSPVEVVLPAWAERPTDDELAAFFATLSGGGLDSLAMEGLSVTPAVREAIEDLAGCELDAGEVQARPAPPRGNYLVSFSGGFDSLAATALTPGEPTLVSVDFGGWLSREASFFSRFEPHVVSTNFRLLGFARRNWMFMLCGVILLGRQLGAGNYVTGSILESSAWHLRREVSQMTKAPLLLQSLGFRQFNTTNGLTEICTTALAVRQEPRQIMESLASLAGPGTPKLFIKTLLLRHVVEAGLVPAVDVPSLEIPQEPILHWGEILGDDFRTFYLVKILGVDLVRQVVSGVPDVVFDIGSSADLSLYRRFNPDLYQGARNFESEHISAVLSASGITPYTERDWREYRQIVDVLSEFYPVPKVG